LVARNVIHADEVVEAAAVQKVMKKVSFPSPSAVTDSGAVVGKAARRLIRQGEELRPEMFGEPQAVRRGQNFDVRIGSGRFSIQLTAMAESNARAGEYVTLRNPESGKSFRALATSPGRAQLNLNQEGK